MLKIIKPYEEKPREPLKIERMLTRPTYKKITHHEYGDILVKKGTVPWFSVIQEGSDTAHPTALIEKYLTTGDYSFLQKNQTAAMYQDTTVMPGSYQEVMNTVSEAVRLWEELPLEVRASIGSVQTFISTNWEVTRPDSLQNDIKEGDTNVT